ncbi:12310_t:CDS:1, partial [Ambispora gerdemannii]
SSFKCGANVLDGLPYKDAPFDFVHQKIIVAVLRKRNGKREH